MVPKDMAQVDAMSVVELCRRAAGQFVREAREQKDPCGFRFDISRSVQVPDKKIEILGRAHTVGVRITVRCESLLFEGVGSATKIFPSEVA